MADLRVTTFDLLRHGRCEGGEMFRGSTDVALLDSGLEAMAGALSGLGGWQRIVSSPMRRCLRFARQQATTLGLPLTVEPDLREIHFGDWEGQTHAEVARQHGDLLARFWQDPEQVTPPNGESIQHFRQRVTGVLERLQRGHAGEHLLLVTHGAVIRLTLCHWLDLPLSAISRVAVPYAGLTRFRTYQAPGQPPWPELVLHRGEERGGAQRGAR